jgi:hypothetical protein
MAKKPVTDKEPIIWGHRYWSYWETGMGAARHHPCGGLFASKPHVKNSMDDEQQKKHRIGWFAILVLVFLALVCDLLGLIAKAQAKIQSNKQKKLDKIILFAQKKKIFANEDVQKLLHISSATATRYLAKLVQQGRLNRVVNPRDAKYQFVR